MSRVARKHEVSATFFRVDGADQETGEETYLVLQASTKPQAEKLARKQGLLISSVRVARPDDWSAPAEEPPAVPSTAEMDIYTRSQATAPHATAAAEPAPAESAEEPDGYRAEDMVGFPEPPTFPPPSAAPTDGPAPNVEPDYRDDYPGGATPFMNPVPTPADTVHAPPADVVEPSPAGSVAAPGATAPARRSSAAAIVLGCVGAALLLGGVLALSLALWPDNAARNELQQIDYRLHEVSQTILGGMLVLAGMMTFTLAIICYLLPRRTARA